MSNTIQMYIVSIFQIVIAIGLINVWIVRFNKPTKYRGKSANNMKDEFLAYGLPVWFMCLVGVLKTSIALSLLAGFWFTELIYPASAVLVVLMVGAICMHLKVRDPFIRFLPAIAMLSMALINVILIVII